MLLSASKRNGKLLLVVLAAFTALPFVVHAREDSSDTSVFPGTKSLSRSSKAARPGVKNDKSLLSLRTKMSDPPSLGEKITFLADDSNEFATRLLQEEAKSLENVKHQRANSLTRASYAEYSKICIAAGVTTLVAAMSLCVAAPMLFPSADPMALSSASSVLALLPFKDFNTKTSMLVMDAMAVTQLLSRDYVRDYVQVKVVPAAWSMFHKMLWMEFWRRTWKFVGSRVAQLVQNNNDNTSDNSENKEDDWIAFVPPWLAETHAFVKGTIQRGTYKLFQKSVQRQVQATFIQVFEAVSKQCENALQLLLHAPEPIAIAATSH